MTTPQWTVVDNGLVYDDSPDPTARRSVIQRDLAEVWPDHWAALVADVAAARLVDDLATVVRAAEAAIEWWNDDTRGGEDEMETLRLAVAALHHARQQEGT